MTIHITTDAEVRREVAQLLLQYLTPAKLARFWADWQVGQRARPPTEKNVL